MKQTRSKPEADGKAEKQSVTKKSEKVGDKEASTVADITEDRDTDERDSDSEVEPNAW